MRKDNEILRYVDRLERRARISQWRTASITSLIVGSFSGAIAGGIMILIFK